MLIEHKAKGTGREKGNCKKRKRIPKRIHSDGAIDAWVNLSGLLRKPESVSACSSGFCAIECNIHASLLPRRAVM